MTYQPGAGKAAAKTFPALTLARANAILTAPGTPFEMEERSIRGVPTRVWKNAPPTLRDLFLVSRKPSSSMATSA